MLFEIILKGVLCLEQMKSHEFTQTQLNESLKQIYIFKILYWQFSMD